jgi:hypothetical protein
VITRIPELISRLKELVDGKITPENLSRIAGVAFEILNEQLLLLKHYDEKSYERFNDGLINLVRESATIPKEKLDDWIYNKVLPFYSVVASTLLANIKQEDNEWKSIC